MARDVEYNVTASDKSAPALASAEERYRRSQERIRKINADNQKKMQADGEKYAARIGSALEAVFGRTAPKLAIALGDSFAQAAKSGGPLLAGAIAVGAPIIAADLSAAVIGGAGIGGLVGGALLAARDPRVKAAGAQLGKTMLAELQQDASPIVAPLLHSLDVVEARFELSRGKLQKIFGTSAGFMDPLVRGALDGIDHLLSGFQSLVANADPVIKSLGKDLDELGGAGETALKAIAGGSGDAASALTQTVHVLSAMIVTTGYTIKVLTDLYGVVSFLPSKINDTSEAVANFLGIGDRARAVVGPAAQQTAQMAIQLAATGDAATAAAGPVGTFTDKINNLASAGRGLFDATTQVGEATANLKTSLKENGKTLDENTVKGRANRQALSGLASALQAWYNAEVTANGEGKRSNQIAGENRTAFIKLATQFGKTKTQAADLATKMGLIPGKKNSDFYLNTHDAEGRAKAARDAINSIHGKTVSIGVTIAQSQLRRVQNTLSRLGGFNGAAAGGAWFAVDPGSGSSRTQPPNPINLTSNLTVDIDGAPYRRYTTGAIRASNDRMQWRLKVGYR